MKNQNEINERGFLAFVMENGGKYAPIIFPIDGKDEVSIMNSTVCINDGRLFVFSRVCNYITYVAYDDIRSPYGLIRDAVHPETDRHLRSKIYYMAGGTDLGFTDWGEVMFPLSSQRKDELDESMLYHGLEDPRAVVWNGKMTLFGTIFMKRDDALIGRIMRSELAERNGTFEEEYFEIMPGSNGNGNSIEKNWMPFADECDAWLTWVSPNSIMKKENDGYYREYTASDFSPSAPHRYRGGSQFIKIDGGWLGVVHTAGMESIRNNEHAYKYRHAFVFLDDNKMLREVSDTFAFSESSCGEFCSGIAQDDEYIYMTFSIEDSSSNIIKFPKSLII